MFVKTSLNNQDIISLSKHALIFHQICLSISETPDVQQIENVVDLFLNTIKCFIFLLEFSLCDIMRC